MDSFSIEGYDYHLPQELIAQQPADPRDSSRLMVLNRAAGTWQHKTFADFPDYFGSGDLMVANNTRVLKARLLGHRLKPGENERILGGKVEFVLLEEKSPQIWEGLFHASAVHKAGLQFLIPTPDSKGLRGKLIQGSIDSPHGTVIAEFDRDPIESGAGEVPLPHYIDRSPKSGDEKSYQTVYAKYFGSAAAPTAGLHFTPEVMNRLNQKGVQWKEITLHVGLGTFRPVKDTDIRKHLMHAEAYEIFPEVGEAICAAKSENRKITAIGTTSVRTLESAWDFGQNLMRSGREKTSIFIHPGGAPFRIVDQLLTNFHLPRSTLLMLVCAFAGREFALAAYEEAIKEKYRFFSYGDAMLIL